MHCSHYEMLLLFFFRVYKTTHKFPLAVKSCCPSSPIPPQFVALDMHEIFVAGCYETNIRDQPLKVFIVQS